MHTNGTDPCVHSVLVIRSAHDQPNYGACLGAAPGIRYVAFRQVEVVFERIAIIRPEQLHYHLKQY